MLKRLLVFLSFALMISTDVNAQYFSMPTTIRTPYGNVTTYNNSYMPMVFGKSIPYKKHEYTVVLKNDSVFIGKGKMNTNKGIAFLRLKSKNASKKFTPKDTKEVYRLTKDGTKISGVPSFKDSCWLFKVFEGKINEYAIVPEWNTTFISAVQKGDDPRILKITKENIVPLVSDNPKALKKAKKEKLDVALDIYNKER